MLHAKLLIALFFTLMFYIHTVFFLSLSHIQSKEFDLTKTKMLIIRLFIRLIFLFKTAPTNETITNQIEDEEEEAEEKVEEEQNVEEEEVDEEEEEGAGEEEGNFKFFNVFL